MDSRNPEVIGVITKHLQMLNRDIIIAQKNVIDLHLEQDKAFVENRKAIWNVILKETYKEAFFVHERLSTCTSDTMDLEKISYTSKPVKFIFQNNKNRFPD